MGSDIGRKTKNIFATIGNYSCNGLFIFFFLAVHYYAELIIDSGKLAFTPMIMLLLALLFYLPSAFIYSQQGGYPFLISIICCIFMLIAAAVLFLGYSEYYLGKNLYEDFSPFLIISSIPLLFAMIINVLNGVLIISRYQRQKKEKLI